MKLFPSENVWGGWGVGLAYMGKLLTNCCKASPVMMCSSWVGGVTWVAMGTTLGIINIS